jgi:hypothetical protein
LQSRSPRRNHIANTGPECASPLYSPLVGYRKTIQHALQLSSKHQCDCTVNLSKAIRQSQTPATNNVGADWGLQTLRQACFQENPESAMCVQNFDDSRGLAIRITYRISLRSSSLWEPRHPLLKVVIIVYWASCHKCSWYP